MAQKPTLNVLRLEGFTKQRIIPQINHAHGEVIARGNHAAVEDYQIVFTGAKNHRALAPSHRADQESSANDRRDFFR